MNMALQAHQCSPMYRTKGKVQLLNKNKENPGFTLSFHSRA